MKNLLEPKIFPFVSFLVSLIFGLVAWGLGAKPDNSIGIAVLIELVLLAHYILERINHIGSILGYSRGFASISDLVPSLNMLSKSNNTWIKHLLQLRIEQFSLNISYLRNNRIPMRPDEFMEFAEVLFQSIGPQDKFEAVSLFGGGEYWKHKYGQRYAALNQVASKRGVKIIRTFIPRNEDNHNALSEIYAEQSSYCEIFVSEFNSINELDKQSAKDFFLLNNELAVEFVFNADYSDMDHIDVITSENEIKNVYRRRMDKIRSLSSPYSNTTP